MSGLDSIFWISFVTIISGCVLKLASLCFKSKCKECSICGGRIKITRDIEGEQRATEFELNHPPQPSPKNDNI
jgi:hypothetical protein